MLDVLWTLRGSIPLNPTASYGGVLDRVATMLEQQKKPVRRADANAVTFNVPLWRRERSWKALTLYNEGRFSTEHGLDGRVLRYRLSCLHLFVGCIVLAAGLTLIALQATPLDHDAAYGNVGFVAAVYALNMLVGWFRATRVIREAVRGG
ncbi:MAG: hypothetical protein QM608_11945 [Caulobacter sp.]